MAETKWYFIEIDLTGGVVGVTASTPFDTFQDCYDAAERAKGDSLGHKQNPNTFYFVEADPTVGPDLDDFADV